MTHPVITSRRRGQRTHKRTKHEAEHRFAGSSRASDGRQPSSTKASPRTRAAATSPGPYGSLGAKIARQSKPESERLEGWSSARPKVPATLVQDAAPSPAAPLTRPTPVAVRRAGPPIWTLAVPSARARPALGGVLTQAFDWRAISRPRLHSGPRTSCTARVRGEAFVEEGWRPSLARLLPANLCLGLGWCAVGALFSRPACDHGWVIRRSRGGVVRILPAATSSHGRWRHGCRA